MKVFLVPNYYKQEAVESGLMLELWLSRQGYEVVWAADQRSKIQSAPDVDDADLVITLGGDGTLLKAGLDCVHYGKPVLGVNLGRTGFLATCEVEEMPEKLRLLAEGRYTLDPRGLLLARSANGWQAEAINDVVLFGRTRMHPMDYKVYCDGCFVSSYRSDGLILATPTGSTAYSYSAGGPIVEPEAKNIIITPICAHEIGSRCIVASDKRVVSVEQVLNARRNAYLSVDGGRAVRLNMGDVATIRKSHLETRLVRLKERSFYDVVSSKFSK